MPSPCRLALPAGLTGPGPVIADVYCAENLPLLQTMTDAWAGRFQLIYLDPPFGSWQGVRRTRGRAHVSTPAT